MVKITKFDSYSKSPITFVIVFLKLILHIFYKSDIFHNFSYILKKIDNSFSIRKKNVNTIGF